MKPRTAAVTVAVGSLIAFAGVDMIGDATQTRPDELRKGYRSEVVFQVTTRNSKANQAMAAESLWGACRHTATRRVVDPLTAIGEGTYRVVVQPELGPHARQRLTGCLEDLTLDRINGDVKSVKALPRPR